MARALHLPAVQVRLGVDLPDVCAQHGLRGGRVSWRVVTFVSKTPGWLFVVYVVSIVIGILVSFVIRSSITSASWPVCETCLRTRRRCRRAMWACATSWLPLSWFTIAFTGSGWLALLTLLVMPLAALCFGLAGSWSSVTKAWVSQDAQTLTLEGTDPVFLAEWSLNAGAAAAGSPAHAAVVRGAEPATSDGFTFFG